MPEKLLEVNHLRTSFFTAEGEVKSVSDVSYYVNRGEVIAIVGESGCGKSTLVRTILQIHPATEGEVIFEGQNILELKGEELRQNRRKIQMVFQDPTAAFNPKMRVKDILCEPLLNFGLLKNSEVDAKAAELLQMVELPVEFKDRFPHSMSGGQRQRLGIARALSLEPQIIVCDEATSALDVATERKVLRNIMEDTYPRTCIVTTHRPTVLNICSRVYAIRDMKCQVMDSEEIERMIRDF